MQLYIYICYGHILYLIFMSFPFLAGHPSKNRWLFRYGLEPLASVLKDCHPNRLVKTHWNILAGFSGDSKKIPEDLSCERRLKVNYSWNVLECFRRF